MSFVHTDESRIFPVSNCPIYIVEIELRKQRSCDKQFAKNEILNIAFKLRFPQTSNCRKTNNVAH